MRNCTFAVIDTAKNSIEFLAENIEELENPSTPTDEERVTKAKEKLKAAAVMVREVFELLKEDE